jgi:hypothetical protein
MTAQRRNACPARQKRKDAMARPQSVLDTVYHFEPPSSANVPKKTGMVTILATMASPNQ